MCFFKKISKKKLKNLKKQTKRKFAPLLRTPLKTQNQMKHIHTYVNTKNFYLFKYSFLERNPENHIKTVLGLHEKLRFARFLWSLLDCHNKIISQIDEMIVCKAIYTKLFF